MNNAIQILSFERNKMIGVLLLSLISMIAGLALSFFLRIGYRYLFLSEVVLFIFMIAALNRRIKRFFLAFLVIMIPVNIDKSLFLISDHSGGVPGLVISAWSLILLSLYIIWFIECSTGNKRTVHYFPQITIPLGLLLAISILSIVKSVSIQLSIFQIVQLIKVCLLLFYIANNIHTEKDYKFILNILFATLFLEICLGYYQYFINDFIDLGILSDVTPYKARELGHRTIMSVTGTLTGDGRFADYLSLILSVLLASLLSRGKTIVKLIYLSFFASGIMLLIFTFSRGAWIGFGIGLVFFLVLQIIHSRKRVANYIKIFTLAFLAFIIIYSFRDLIFERIYGEDYGSALSRLPMMRIGLEMIKANPILGVGINNYVTTMSKYDPIGLSYVYHQPVHNVIIQLTAEVGISGLLTFLWFILTLYVYGIKYMMKSNEFFKNQMIGLMTGITALFIHGLFNNATIATDPFILFWLFGGLILSITKMNQQKSR